MPRAARLILSDPLGKRGMSMASLRPQAPVGSSLASLPVLVAFVCANCGRSGRLPTSGRQNRPQVPDFRWPASVHAHQVVVPCAGRLQPEQLLKVFESGADAVCVVACEYGNCHYLEGGLRCRRRLDYVDHLLQQIGIGQGRLMLFQLPGSARQDMELGAGERVLSTEVDDKVAAIRQEVVSRLKSIAPNALHRSILPQDARYELDDLDESD